MCWFDHPHRLLEASSSTTAAAVLLLLLRNSEEVLLGHDKPMTKLWQTRHLICNTLHCCIQSIQHQCLMHHCAIVWWWQNHGFNRNYEAVIIVMAAALRQRFLCIPRTSEMHCGWNCLWILMAFCC